MHVSGRSAIGQTLEWNLDNQRGRVVANGVHLYVVTAKGSNGQVIRSQVKKLVFLR